MRTGALLLAAFVLSAQQTRDPIEVMHEALPKLVEAMRNLPRYTCVQTVTRTYFRQNRARPSCDETLDYKKSGYLPLEETLADRLRLDVAVDDAGREIFSWPGSGPDESRSIPEFLGGGPLGTGAFGPFLVGIFGNRDVHFFYEHEDRAAGHSRHAYRFRVPLELSRYQVLVGEVRRPVPYDGTFYLSRESAELERLTIHTGALAAGLGVCDLTNTIDFGRRTIGTSEYLLPRESRLYAVGLGVETESRTTWSNCREYGAETLIRFEGENPPAFAAGPQASGSAGRSLPPGLAMTLALENEIDTDRAAAGDVVTAKLRRDLVDPVSRQVFAPAGALVRGRITRMERHVVAPGSFHIAIRFEFLETGGATVPLAAELDSKTGSLSEFRVSSSALATAQSPSSAAVRRTIDDAASTLVIPSAQPRQVLPRGYESRWITVPPRAEP